jgi:hypothetical protein
MHALEALNAQLQSRTTPPQMTDPDLTRSNPLQMTDSNRHDLSTGSWEYFGKCAPVQCADSGKEISKKKVCMFFSVKRVQKGKSLDDWQEPLQTGEMVWIGKGNKTSTQVVALAHFVVQESETGSAVSAQHRSKTLVKDFTVSLTFCFLPRLILH